MASRKEIKGVIPPMITVFKDDESIDEEGTRDHVRFLLDNGCHGVVVGGSTGEFIAMRLEERKRVAEIVVDEVREDGVAFVGTGHYSTKITVELCQHAQEIGADGVMIICPYYMGPPKDDVMNHFRTITKNTDLPIMVYNNPWFAGYELTSWEIKQLVDEGVVSIIKAAHGDVNRVHDLKYLCGDKLTVLYGHDLDAPEAFLCGADGLVSGIPNVLPRLSRDLYDAGAEEKDVGKTMQIWNKMLPLVHFTHYNKTPEGRPHWLSVMKEALNILGRKVGKPRLPLTPLNKKEQKNLEEILKKIQ